jgi:hypothetical protein
MTRHHQESLDETIDRVAAHLTMVPADPALAVRIADRLETKAVVAWPRFALAGAVVAAVAILAVIVSNVRREEAPPAGEATPSVTRTTLAVADTASAAAGEPFVRRRRAPAPTHEPLPEMPQIDALASPVLLAIDTLPTDMLTIDPADLAPLGMADLSVAEIDGRDSPKE